MDLKTTKKTKRYGDWITPAVIRHKLNSTMNRMNAAIVSTKTAKNSSLRTAKGIK